MTRPAPASTRDGPAESRGGYRAVNHPLPECPDLVPILRIECDLGNRARIDGVHLDFDTVRQLSAAIAAMSYAERVAHPCIGRERADLVVAGCAILEAICRIWPVGRLRVADRGLREGILFNMMQARPQASPAVRAAHAAR